MFGYCDKFEYLECSKCGCLQLQNKPDDLKRYYPEGYYPTPRLVQNGTLKRRLNHERAKYCLGGSSLIGRLLVLIYGRPRCGIFGDPDCYEWLKKCKVSFDSRIADIGCGSGTLLHRLHADGFSDLTGIDPYINSSMTSVRGLRILKEEIYNLHESFDLIMLHHTFEHLSEPVTVLDHLRRLLTPSGNVLMRIPIASSFAYEQYGSNWVQLDAPRHMFLYTVKSLGILAARVGFKVTDIVFDSTDFQFWASEQYLRNIPLKDDCSYAIDPAKSGFKRKDIIRFKQAAQELNRKQAGDSACVYLSKQS
jgi:SAM-dependent methyltransferase